MGGCISIFYLPPQWESMIVNQFKSNLNCIQNENIYVNYLKKEEDEKISLFEWYF